MKIAISGSSGMVGTALIPALMSQQHEVWRLLRLKEKPQNTSKVILWDPEAGTMDKEALEGFDAVIHLGGLNLASASAGTRISRRGLWESRVASTRLLAEALASLKNPPKFSCAPQLWAFMAIAARRP